MERCENIVLKEMRCQNCVGPKGIRFRGPEAAERSSKRASCANVRRSKHLFLEVCSFFKLFHLILGREIFQVPQFHPHNTVMVEYFGLLSGNGLRLLRYQQFKKILQVMESYLLYMFLRYIGHLNRGCKMAPFISYWRPSGFGGEIRRTCVRNPSIVF